MSMAEIKCRLCDLQYNVKQFGMHVSRTHKMKYEDYAKQYWMDLPNWSPCSECGEICKDTYCSTECYSKGQSKMLSARELKPMTETHRKNISKAAKKRLSNPENHPMYGKHHNVESVNKISSAAKERLANPENHPLYGTNLTLETKEKISKSQKEYYKENDQYLKGKSYNEYFGNERAGEIIKKIFQSKPMNKLEKKVADYLDELGIKYTFQFFLNADGVCKSYDFKIKNTNLILEVHGDYWHGGDGVEKHVFNVNETIKNDKLKVQLAKSKGYDVVVIWESEIKKDISVVNKTINEYLYKSK